MAPERAGAERFLAGLRTDLRKGNVYRGHVEMRTLQISFHVLPQITRDSIILPGGLLDRIERQTVRFDVELSFNGCPGCGTRRIRALQRITRKVIDLKYFSAGVRKWVVKYVSWRYQCEKCHATFVHKTFPRAKNKYGRGLASWCVYQNVACGQNMLQVGKALSEVFQLPLGSQQFYRFKTAVADYFRPAYDRILTQILKGHLLHAGTCSAGTSRIRS